MIVTKYIIYASTQKLEKRYYVNYFTYLPKAETIFLWSMYFEKVGLFVFKRMHKEDFNDKRPWRRKNKWIKQCIISELLLKLGFIFHWLIFHFLLVPLLLVLCNSRNLGLYGFCSKFGWNQFTRLSKVETQYKYWFLDRGIFSNFDQTLYCGTLKYFFPSLLLYNVFKNNIYILCLLITMISQDPLKMDTFTVKFFGLYLYF